MHMLADSAELVIGVDTHKHTHTAAVVAAATGAVVAQRREAERMTNREIRRCLVRYVARQLYRLLEQPARFTQHRSVKGNDNQSNLAGQKSWRWPDAVVAALEDVTDGVQGAFLASILRRF